MDNLFSDALARYHAETAVVYDEAVWASRLLACPRQHAHERRLGAGYAGPNDVPTHPYLLEKPPELLHLFEMGTMVEERWFQILSLSCPCQRQVPVRAKGVTGKIDILLRFQTDDNADGTTYQDVPVEIKYTQVSDPAHLWQLAAYLYAGGYEEGYLIRDRGKEQEIVQLKLDMVDVDGPGYAAYQLNGLRYSYNGHYVVISHWALAQLIEAHNAAFLRPEEGQLLQPTIGRCCKQEGEWLVPHCAWFGQCWNTGSLRLDTEWEDGACYMKTQATDGFPVRYEVAGDWRRKPEVMGEF